MKFELPSFVLEILNIFDKAGFEIYIVGGAVRDLLSKKIVDDWDFTTNAVPEEILKILPGAFYDNVFGTVGFAHSSSPNPYEITTYRREFDYTDHRRPSKVEWGKTLGEDLERRDFTINAIALKIQNPKSPGLAKRSEAGKIQKKEFITLEGDIIDHFG